MLGAPLPAEAAPSGSHLGIMGIPALSLGGEAQLHLPGTPVSLAGQGAMLAGSYGQVTGWGEYRHALDSHTSIGLLAGVNLDWQPIRSPAASAATAWLAPGKIGTLIGAFYMHDRGSWWLRVAPSLSLIPMEPLPPRPDQLDQGYTYRAPDVNLGRSLVGGPPWLEIGYRVSPGVGLSLRSSITPLSASLTF